VAQHGPHGSFSIEVDIVVDETRVAVADAVFLSKQERIRQNDASKRAGKIDATRTRILVPPTLIIESVSPGHESHDRLTKRRWYAEFGVPNYWILDAYQRSLECLILDAGVYKVDQSGSNDAELRPSAFSDLVLRLHDLWGE
jgi:Uma2 family endonuclease